jgi:dihydrofolate reductase
MSRLRVHNFSISLDGYGAGPGQDVENPLGVGGLQLHEWVFTTRAFRQLHGGGDPDPGTEGDPVDERFVRAGETGIGATIMGRNMFGPIRGAWPDESWTGWWGEDPPYHHPTFVLTHHARPSITMQGGTVFHFVTDGIESALEKAVKAADGADVRLGGGVATIQAYLQAGLVDEMHLAIAPVLLGRGERLFDNLDGGPAGLTCVELVSSPKAVHARFVRTGQ